MPTQKRPDGYPASKPWPPKSLGHGGGSWQWKASARKEYRYELWHVVNGTRCVERKETPAECIDARDLRREQMKAQREAEVVDEEGDARGDTDMLMSVLTAKWLAFVKGGKAEPSTKKSYRWYAEIIDKYLGRRRASSLTVGNLEDFLRDAATKGGLTTKPLCDDTIAKLRSHLFAVLAYGERRGHVPVNLVPRMGKTRVRDDEDDDDGGVVWLKTKDEFDRMRAYLNAHPSTTNRLFLLQLMTGLRPGEARGIMRDNLDLERGLLDVRTQARDRVLTHKLKNRKSRRTVELPPDVIRALHEERREQRARHMAAPSWTDEGTVFTGPQGRLFSPEVTATACDQICAAIGVERMTPNGFRHSNASMLLSLGMPPVDVAAHLGHTDMRMLARYGHSMHKVAPTAALFGGA